MATIYKKFTPQDYSYTPFNAHKQYKYNSGSASSIGIKIFNARYTSESIDVYSSGSGGGSASGDYFNSIKYNQIDHLYYRNFKRDITNRFGDYHYINQKRELYDKVNILSVPVGLSGHSIKKGSFYLSASLYNRINNSLIVDDSEGNLIVSGTNLDNYITDCRKNILRIGPVEGFKRYDLNTIGVGPIDKNGHLMHRYSSEPAGFQLNETTPEEQATGYLAYRKGKKRIKNIEKYSTPNLYGDEFDDSYYHNIINYKNVKFSQKHLFVHKKLTNISSSRENHDFVNSSDKFPAIDFRGESEIKISNDDKFNFNPGDNFLISFWLKLNSVGSNLIIGDYTIPSDLEGNKQYIIEKSTSRTIVPSPTEGQSELFNTNVTGALQETHVPSETQYPFEVYVDKPSTATHPFVYFSRSDGDIITTISASLTQATSSLMQHLSCRCSASQMEIFVNGVGAGISGSDNTINPTKNTANIYIGNKGGKSNYLNGSLSQINIYNTPFSNTQIKNHYSSSNGSPYIGNIFYSHGIATITHPGHQNLLSQNSYIEDKKFDRVDARKTRTYEFNLNQIGFSGRSIAITGSHLLAASDIRNIRLKPDGTKVFLCGHSDNIFQYKLNTPYDISTAIFEKTVAHPKVELHGSVMADIGNLSGITFNNDGSKIFTTCRSKDLINEITLTGSYDIGSMSVSKSICIGSASFLGNHTATEVDGAGIIGIQCTAPRFSHDGKTLFFFTQWNKCQIGSIELSSSFDIGSHKVHILKAGESVGGDHFGNSGSVEAFKIDYSLGHYGKVTSTDHLQAELLHDDDAGDMDFNDEGTELIYTNLGASKLMHYHLSSSYDIWTAYNISGSSRDLPLSSETYNDATDALEGPLGLDWIEAGPATGIDSRIYITGFDNDGTNSDVIHEYHISKSAIHQIKFQGTHLIYEHEYQCSVDEGEYNDTYNITARKIKSSDEEDMADFATGSLFKPYVTTIGLYNEADELLVVGKLASPIRMSDETDTTFVVRWDV